MTLLAAEDAKRGPYQPCPCGSGKKFRFCHGNSSLGSPFSGVASAKAAAPEKRVIPLHTEHLSARASDSARGATK
jgi:hypothetical protein